jgi:uncharacterized protein (TIGR02145 family)
MNHLIKMPAKIFIMIGIFCCNSCIPDPPIVETIDVSDITQISAESGGNVRNDGGADVIARGVCWSTNQNPDLSSSKTSDGKGIGPFTSKITGLMASTTFYVRAYATNGEGTGYGNEVSFMTGFNTLQDVDGNSYNIVQIGTQLWMKENLKTTRYKDGGSIPLVQDNTEWSNITYPGYCWYNNDAATYKGTYGALYNWYSVNTDRLCPTGWHVPNESEWTALTNYLGGTGVAGGKLKETGTSHWNNPNTGATNETGFTAIPCGYRSYGGEFTAIGSTGAWWSSTETDAYSAGTRGLRYDSGSVDSYINGKMHGFSVRCIKN